MSGWQSSPKLIKIKHTASSSTNKKIVLNITPQTHIRSTVGDRILFRIPRNKLKPSGLRRLTRLERYNNYKISVSALAKAQRFEFPQIGARIKFFLPVPASWSKTKKVQMHNQYHTTRSDLDNLIKALLDSLMAEDKHIAHFEASKHWINSPSGYIEITHSSKDIYIE